MQLYTLETNVGVEMYILVCGKYEVMSQTLISEYGKGHLRSP